ncbi:MAG: hypothetical protein MJ248_04610 [Bacilli bacterium]|nr:hypothetical protein [Bacilli bacterium]
MCLLKKTKKNIEINSRFKLNDFVDFYHRDDIYFGSICDIYLNDRNEVIYDIQIAGQCPTVFKGVNESKVIRIHK